MQLHEREVPRLRELESPRAEQTGGSLANPSTSRSFLTTDSDPIA